MLPVVSFAPFNGWRPAAVAAAPHWSQMCMHTFQATEDGQLAHYTDGALRATVPPEGWADFVALWPDAQTIVDQLRTPAAAPAEAPAEAG